MASQNEQFLILLTLTPIFYFLLREGVKTEGWMDPKNADGPSLYQMTGYLWTARPGQEILKRRRKKTIMNTVPKIVINLVTIFINHNRKPIKIIL